MNSIFFPNRFLYCNFFFQAQQAIHEGIWGKSLLLLQAYLGIAWVLGCILFGCIVVNNSTECRISKQYLCQAALFMAGVSILVSKLGSCKIFGFFDKLTSSNTICMFFFDQIMYKQYDRYYHRCIGHICTF